jgi:hypothetical protein
MKYLFILYFEINIYYVIFFLIIIIKYFIKFWFLFIIIYYNFGNSDLILIFLAIIFLNYILIDLGFILLYICQKSF